MKCKNCGEELKAQVAITEQGWIIFHECIVKGATEEEVIANFNQLQNKSSNNKYTASQATPKSCPDCSELCGEFTYCENANN